MIHLRMLATKFALAAACKGEDAEMVSDKTVEADVNWDGWRRLLEHFDCAKPRILAGLLGGWYCDVLIPREAQLMQNLAVVHSMNHSLIEDVDPLAYHRVSETFHVLPVSAVYSQLIAERYR